MPRKLARPLRLLVLSALFASPSLLLADGPKDNLTENVRQIPPPGIVVTESDRGELEAGLTGLQSEIDQLRTPPNSRGPGKIVAADFFSETWELDHE